LEGSFGKVRAVSFNKESAGTERGGCVLLLPFWGRRRRRGRNCICHVAIAGEVRRELLGRNPAHVE